MRGKLLFATGLAVGYVVGARAGRPAYDALTARFGDLTASPRVREAASAAKSALEERAPAVAGVIEQAAQTAAGTVTAVQEAPADARAPEDGDGTTPSEPSGSEAKPRRRARTTGGAPAKADD